MAERKWQRFNQMLMIVRLLLEILNIELRKTQIL